MGSTVARLGWGEGKPCLHPCLCSACSLRFPPPSPCKRAFCAAGFFSPLLIPNQEIKGRQRLRLFPLCRELESSGRGDRPFPDRPRGGGHAPQVEGPAWGEHPGSSGGGSQGHSWDEGTPGIGGNPAGAARGLRAPAGGWEAICSRGGGGGRLRRMAWPARRLLGVFPANSWLTPQQLGRERIPQPRQPPGAGAAGRDHGSAWLGTAWHSTSVTRRPARGMGQ